MSSEGGFSKISQEAPILKHAEFLQSCLGDVSTDKQYMPSDVPMLIPVEEGNGASYLKEE